MTIINHVKPSGLTVTNSVLCPLSLFTIFKNSTNLNGVNRLVLTMETVLCEVGTGFIREFLNFRSAALQVGGSRVRFPMVSLEFSIDLILLAALWPWGRLSL